MLRNRQQVYNAFRSVEDRKKTRDTGPNKGVDFAKLVVALNKKKFLRDVSFMHKNESLYPFTFAMCEQAIGWIKQFCSPLSDPPVKSQVQIDMTYKVGLFYVTVLSCAHPMFTMQNDKTRHPTVFLGMTTTTSKDVGAYEYLAGKLHSAGIHTPHLWD